MLQDPAAASFFLLDRRRPLQRGRRKAGRRGADRWDQIISGGSVGALAICAFGVSS